MRCRGQQEEVTREPTEELTEFVALRWLDLAAEKRGGHLVCLVADHHIPIRQCQLRLDILVAAQLVQAADEKVAFSEDVPAARRLHHLARENVERQVKATKKF